MESVLAVVVLLIVILTVVILALVVLVKVTLDRFADGPSSALIVRP